MGQAQLTLSGQVTVMPLTVTGTNAAVGPQGTLPAGTTQVPLSTTPSPKPSNRRAVGSTYLSSPSAFQTIRGVGAGDDVATADFLSVTSDAPVEVELTMQDYDAGGAGTTVSVVYLYGSMHLEFPSSGYLVGLRAKGAANLEYLISGPA